jgi:hypothetical protein
VIDCLCRSSRTDDILEKIEYNFGNGIGEPPTSGLVPRKFQKDYFYGTTSTLVSALITIDYLSINLWKEYY